MRIINSLSLVVIVIFFFLMLGVRPSQSQIETTEIIDLPNPEICPQENQCENCCNQLLATVDYFMKIESIDGESTAVGHEKWMDLLSYEHSVVSDGSRRATHSFSFRKKLDKASPLLSLGVNSKEHYKEAILEVCDTTGDRFCYMRYKLTDVTIKSYVVKGDKCDCDGRPVEEVSIEYSKIEWQYKRMGDVGAPEEVTKTGWDLKKNVKV